MKIEPESKAWADKQLKAIIDTASNALVALRKENTEKLFINLDALSEAMGDWVLKSGKAILPIDNLDISER